MRKRRLFIALGLIAALLATNVSWPYLVVRPFLLAEAEKDILSFRDARSVNTAQDTRPSLALGEVFALADGTRLRIISDSHHNNFLAYDGSTYVNVNNRIFFLPSGHCAPRWLVPTDLTKATYRSLTAVLLEHGYREIQR